MEVEDFLNPAMRNCEYAYSSCLRRRPNSLLTVNSYVRMLRIFLPSDLLSKSFARGRETAIDAESSFEFHFSSFARPCRRRRERTRATALRDKFSTLRHGTVLSAVSIIVFLDTDIAGLARYASKQDFPIRFANRSNF
jgi:hypothetical protein